MKMRISASSWHALVQGLHERQDVETAGFVFCDPTDIARGVLVAKRAFVVDDQAYAVREDQRLQLAPEQFHAATRDARRNGWSIFTVHSHPGCRDAWFSWADDRGDARLMPALAVQVPDVPHGSIVVASGGATIARTFDGDRPAPCSIEVVGRTRSLATATSAEEPSETHARQRLALGAAGSAAIAALRVGIVGLGGTGSAVSAQLAHLGVGGLVLVDGDRVETTNVSRIFGATLADVGSTKVDVAQRYARALGVPTETVPRMLGREELGVLGSCDIVFSCVDRQTPRAWLNRFAYDRLVPVIDMGTAFRVDADGVIRHEGGRVVVLGPDRPCMACWDLLDPERLRVEALSAEERAGETALGYITGADVPQPAVIAFNTMVASAAVVELLRIVTGFASGEDPPDRLAFSFAAGTVRRVGRATPRGCQVCGAGGRAAPPVPSEDSS